MSEVLRRMGFIRNDENVKSPDFIQERTLLFDMWVVLRGKEKEEIGSRNLLTFLLAIIGINTEIIEEEMLKLMTATEETKGMPS